MTSERTPSEVSKAVDRLKNLLEERGIVASVGKSALQGAHVELKVNLKSAEKKSQVPSDVDGFPVRTEVTGNIKAL